MKAVFWLGIIVLMQISRLRFELSRISLLIPHTYLMGIDGNRKFGRFSVVLKLELKL